MNHAIKGFRYSTLVARLPRKEVSPSWVISVEFVVNSVHQCGNRADFEKVGISVISRIGDPFMRKRTGISLTADEPLIRNVIS
jgi:hypothetical protein